MHKIVSFSINGKDYTIYDTPRIEGKDSHIGETNYEKGIILIEYGTIPEMMTTVRHELAHVWLYEHGHFYQAGGCFTYEDLCEYIALSNRFVYEISERYRIAKDW